MLRRISRTTTASSRSPRSAASQKARAHPSKSATDSWPCFNYQRRIPGNRRPLPAHGRLAGRRLSRRRRRRHLPLARLAVQRLHRQVGRQPSPRRRHLRSPREGRRNPSATESKSGRGGERERGRRVETSDCNRVSRCAVASLRRANLTSTVCFTFCSTVCPATVTSIVKPRLSVADCNRPASTSNKNLAARLLLLHLRRRTRSFPANVISSPGRNTAYVRPSISFVPS